MDCSNKSTKLEPTLKGTTEGFLPPTLGYLAFPKSEICKYVRLVVNSAVTRVRPQL